MHALRVLIQVVYLELIVRNAAMAVIVVGRTAAPTTYIASCFISTITELVRYEGPCLVM